MGQLYPLPPHPQRMFGKIWKYFWCLQLRGSATGIYWVETRETTNHPTTKAPEQRIISPKMSKVLRLKKCLLRKYLVKDFFLLNHLKIRCKHHDTSLLNIPKNKDIVLLKDKSRDGQLGLLQTPMCSDERKAL